MPDGERPELDPQRTWATFRDYWVAQPGMRGCKADWETTWRNWVRREQIAQPAARRTTREREQAIRDAGNAFVRGAPTRAADGAVIIEGGWEATP